MQTNVIDTLMNRASIRRFEDREVEDILIEQIVRAGQQAPFTGQMYSVIATKDPQKKAEVAKYLGKLPLVGSVFMLVCVDFARLEKFIEVKSRENSFDDYWMSILGIQDASYFAQNMVIAAEGLGLGSVFLGSAPWITPQLKELFQIPPRVMPLVGFVLGYPAENPKPRPRIPTKHVLHWDRYQSMSQQEAEEALQVMDAGLIREGYYLQLQGKIRLKSQTSDPLDYDQYGWGEHISRKFGQGGLNMKEQGKDMKTILNEHGMRLH